MFLLLLLTACVDLWQKISDRTWQTAYITLDRDKMQFYSGSQMQVDI